MIKGLFSKAVVAYCIIITTIITAAVLVISWRTGGIETGTVSALLAFWGGELLLLCLKRVLSGKDTTPADNDIGGDV